MDNPQIQNNIHANTTTEGIDMQGVTTALEEKGVKVYTPKVERTTASLMATLGMTQADPYNGAKFLAKCVAAGGTTIIILWVAGKVVIKTASALGLLPEATEEEVDI